MIKLRQLINEISEQEATSKLTNLYKEYRKLLVQMYGPDGTETKIAVAHLNHLDAQANSSTPLKLTSPQFDKAKQENQALMKKMGELGTEMHKIYQELESVGKEELVKKMRDYQRSETEKYILGLTDQSIVKLAADKKDERDKLEKHIEKRHGDYQDAYKKWLSGPQNTPPPLPPSIDGKQ